MNQLMISALILRDVRSLCVICWRIKTAVCSFKSCVYNLTLRCCCGVCPTYWTVCINIQLLLFTDVKHGGGLLETDSGGLSRCLQAFSDVLLLLQRTNWERLYHTALFYHTVERRPILFHLYLFYCNISFVLQLFCLFTLLCSCVYFMIFGEKRQKKICFGGYFRF